MVKLCKETKGTWQLLNTASVVMRRMGESELVGRDTTLSPHHNSLVKTQEIPTLEEGWRTVPYCVGQPKTLH